MLARSAPKLQPLGNVDDFLRPFLSPRVGGNMVASSHPVFTGDQSRCVLLWTTTAGAVADDGGGGLTHRPPPPPLTPTLVGGGGGGA